MTTFRFGEFHFGDVGLKRQEQDGHCDVVVMMISQQIEASQLWNCRVLKCQSSPCLGKHSLVAFSPSYAGSDLHMVHPKDLVIK